MSTDGRAPNRAPHRRPKVWRRRKDKHQTKDKNLIKDIQRARSSAHLADGATLYDNTDDSHVKRTTALETNMRQMKAASKLGIDPQREKSTSRKRTNKEVKPI